MCVVDAGKELLKYFGVFSFRLDLFKVRVFNPIRKYNHVIIYSLNDQQRLLDRIKFISN